MKEILSLNNNWKKWILTLLAILYGVIHFIYLDKYPILYGDESLYNEPCINFITDKKFSSMLYYPKPVGGFYKSNLIHGRIWNFAQVAIFKLTTPTSKTIRLISFLSGIGLLLLLFIITHKLFKNFSLALFTIIFLAFSHLFIFAFHFSRPDIMVCFFILSSFLLLIKACEDQSALLCFLCGLTASLTIDVHPSGNVAIFLITSAALYSWFKKKITFLNILLIGLGIISGIIYWYSIHVWMDTQLFNEQYPFIKSGHRGFFNRSIFTLISDEMWRWYSFFWQGAFHRNMFILFLLLAGMIQFIRRYKFFEFGLILSALIGAGVGYMLGPSKATWYIIYIYPFFSILLIYFIYEKFISNSLFQKRIAIGLTVLLTLFLAIENYEKLKFYKSNYTQYINKLTAILPQGTKVLASDHCWLGLKDSTEYVPNHIMGHWFIIKKNPPIPEYYQGDYESFFLRQKIEFIVADEEMLSWPYQTDMLKPLLDKHYDLIQEIQDDFYGSSLYLSKKSPRPLVTKIYKIKKHKFLNDER